MHSRTGSRGMSLLAAVFVGASLVADAHVLASQEKPCCAMTVAPRKSAPDFKAMAVIDEKFEKVELNDFKGSWLVLFFFPFDFTFVCPTEIVAFSEAVESFKALNTKVAAVSTDSHHTHLAFIKTPRSEGGLGSIKIPLIADISKRMSSDYGVLVDDEEDDMYGAALRGLFIIDPSGKIRSIQVNDDQVGRNVEETLRLIKGFQHADKNGVVCPANWKGDESLTIKPDHEGSVEFFKEWGAN